MNGLAEVSHWKPVEEIDVGDIIECENPDRYERVTEIGRDYRNKVVNITMCLWLDEEDRRFVTDETAKKLESKKTTESVSFGLKVAVKG